MILSHVELAFNNSVNRSTGYTPFEVVYGFRPSTPLDINALPLLPRPSEAVLDFSNYMRDVYDECKCRLTFHMNSYVALANARRKDRQFNDGDIVLIRLRPEHFPLGSFTKLHACREGPFRVTKKLGTNAYVIKLPSDFGISPVFNIEDIMKFKGGDEVFATLILDVTSILRDLENIAPHDEIDDILDHQSVTTRRDEY